MLGKPNFGHRNLSLPGPPKGPDHVPGDLSGSRSSGSTSRPCPHAPIGCSIWAGQKLNCSRVTHRGCAPSSWVRAGGAVLDSHVDSQEVGPALHCYLSGITHRSRNYPVEILGASSPRVQGLGQGEKGFLGSPNFHLSPFHRLSLWRLSGQSLREAKDLFPVTFGCQQIRGGAPWTVNSSLLDVLSWC